MRSWTDADQALLYTCHLAADLLTGRPMRPAPVRAPFPPRYSVEETYLASGPFTLSIHAAPGDGSYMHDSSFFFATELIKEIYIFMMSEYSGWLTLYIEPSIYGKMFALGMLVYAFVAVLQFRSIKQIPMDEALKNVE